MSFESFRSYFDAAFSAYLEKNIATFSGYSSSPAVAAIAQYAARVASGGKRFRPYLAYVALGVQDPYEHTELFVAIELLHVFALIHDDIMDNGDTRHGVPCAHRAFATQYDSVRIGDGVAILLGDVVFQWSYEALLSYGESHQAERSLLISIWGELIREVIHGQMLDVISPAQSAYTQELIEQKMYLKTARYSFVQPMRLGFAAAGVLDQNNEFAETFGRALGLMFQLQDDLLDVIEGHDKSSFLDIETKQQTLLSWYIQTQAQEKYAQSFAQYFGKTLDASDKKNITTLLEESGARSYVQERIDAYYQEALGVAHTEEWNTLAAMVYARSK